MLLHRCVRAHRVKPLYCRRLASHAAPHHPPPAAEEASSGAVAPHKETFAAPLERWQQKTSHYGPLNPTRKEVVHTCLTAEEAHFQSHAAKFEPGEYYKEITRGGANSSVLSMFRLPESVLAVSNVQLFRSIILNNSDYLQKRVDEWCREYEKEDQSLLPARMKALGPELAAGHFLVHRGGAVRMLGSEEWVTKDEDGDIDLPGIYDPQYKVAEIDLSNFKNFAIEGFQNTAHLQHLENIILRGNDRVSNWYIDTICCQHAGSLRRIDMSYCKLLTVEAVTALGRLPLLEEATLEGLSISALELQLACLQLLEERPHLIIRGVQGLAGLIES